MSTTTVRERGILFSGRLVRAILDGRKTQTRRVVGVSLDSIDNDVIRRMRPRQRAAYRFMWADPDHEISLRPYAMPGERLWVRETWAHADNSSCDGADCAQPTHVLFRATESYPESIPAWRPSLFMPRWASRIDLEVVAVRVERLQAISEADARAEGIAAGRIRADDYGPERIGYGFTPKDESTLLYPNARRAFEVGWDSINGKRAGASWAANPFVWAISFRRIR